MLGIYCRISRLKEDGKDRSIDDQRLTGIEFAKKNNLEYKVYIDEGISGTKSEEDRPALYEMFNDITDGKINSVFVYDQSRLERNPQLRFAIKKLFKDNNISLYYRDGIVGSSIEEEFAGDIMSLINNFYVKIGKGKIKSALRRNAEQGRAHGITPYGYTKDKDNMLVIDKDEAKIIRKVYKWSLSGIGTNKIAEKLNDLGVPTRYNKIGKGVITIKNKYDEDDINTVEKKSIKWAGNTVRSFIVNPIYKGIREFAGKQYKCPAIFDELYWEQVNKNLKNNANNSGKKVEHKYLLKGLLRCGKCGRNMYGRTRTNKKDNYYMCSSKRYKDLNCGNRSINIDFLEKFVMSKFYGDAKLYDKVKEHYNNLNNSDELKRLGDKLKSHKDALKTLKKEFDRVMKTYIKGVLTMSDIETYKKSYDAKIIDETLLINNLENQIKSVKGISSEKFIQGLNVKSKLSFNEKRDILHKYIKNIRIEYLDDYYYIETNFNIQGYRERKELVHKSYKYYLVGGSKYYLKPKPNKSTLERVFDNFKKYDNVDI
ncbi:MAG: recombinase family protein [Flavobacteriaceae bacterium]